MPYRSRGYKFEVNIPMPKNDKANFYFPENGGGRYKIEGYVGSD